jgi:hypothetical protein
MRFKVDDLSRLDRIPVVIGVSLTVDIAETIEIARKLQPGL